MKIIVKVDVTLVSIETKLVRSSTLFTFGYLHLMLSLLQYISFYFNRKYSYIRWLSNCGTCIRCAAYFYIHKPK